MKQKLFFTILFSFTIYGSQAQSLERQVIGSAGTFQTASWGSLSSTTGEALTTTLSSSSNFLTQGFQQPLPSDINVKVNEVAPGNFNVRVFPNPAGDFINVVIINGDAGKHYSVTLFDLPGQKLSLQCQVVTTGCETTFKFDLNPLANGSYLINITDQNNLPVQSVKFTKIQ
jgi:hypothetical protein